MCCVQSLQEAEEQATGSEQQASAREQGLQAQVASLRAEARAREESTAALEARLQEALDSASAAAVDRRRLEAKLQQHSEVRQGIATQSTSTARAVSSIEALQELTQSKPAVVVCTAGVLHALYLLGSTHVETASAMQEASRAQESIAEKSAALEAAEKAAEVHLSPVCVVALPKQSHASSSVSHATRTFQLAHLC